MTSSADSRKSYRVIAVILGIFLSIAALFGYVASHQSDKKLHLAFLDVGQGDSILITTPTQNYALVDGGPDEKVIDQLSQEMPFYDRTIELVVLTHPHADHLVGLIEVLKRYEVRNILMTEAAYDSDPYREWIKVVQDEEASVRYAYMGQEMRLGEVNLEVLWPKDKTTLDYWAAKDINNTSIVLLLKYGDFSTLLTGDAGKEILDQLSLDGSVDVYKEPHHGSAGALSLDFLDKIQPTLIVISVGKNSFGHPSALVLGEATKRGVEVLRTDKDGTVEVTSDGARWEVAK